LSAAIIAALRLLPSPQIFDHFLARVILGFSRPVEEGWVRKALDKGGSTETQVVRAKMDLRTSQIVPL
jgi:hypothetical protein